MRIKKTIMVNGIEESLFELAKLYGIPPKTLFNENKYNHRQTIFVGGYDPGIDKNEEGCFITTDEGEAL